MLRRFKNDFPNVTGKKVVLIYPGGGLLPIRAWPLSYYCLLAEDLIQNGFAVGIIGLKSDSEIASVILSHCRHANCIDLTGYTKTVRELMLLFHFASLLITNDGGPGHFASITPVSTIVFYGPETPTLYGALDKKSVNFYANLSCSPCLTAYNHRNSPCDGNNLCLKSIHPEGVLRKSYEILNSQKGNVLK
jgi:ADP-heptose:LPS heptosyltransferase